MKKIFLTLCVAFASIAMYAAGLENVRVYVNPGHGSWGANDRPMATIPYPTLPTTGMPDTVGFYESNTNLWKCLELGKKLEEAGAFVMYSRTQNGPWPYQMVNGDYPDYKKDEYTSRDDYEMYNRSLSEISEEVELGGFDYFISVHSNAASEGTTTNYPLLLYRGTDDGSDQNADSKTRATVLWPYLFEAMNSGIDPYTYYSLTNANVRGDHNFYGSTSTATYSNGKSYTSYLGVLRHGVPGFLSEGYFHTYQPSRHRALNQDYCRQEGVRYYRGIAAYYNHPAEPTGYIMGTVKDLHTKMNNPLFTYNANTNDAWVPCNGAVVTLYKAGVKIADYQVDKNYNGLFVFENLEPGADYTLDATCDGYKPLFEEYKAPITVKANETTYPFIFLEDTAFVPEPIVYEDYPDQAPTAVVGSRYVFENKGETVLAIEGKIKRTIGIGDSTIVLSHTEDDVAHLYLINHITSAIIPISTEGIVADTENKGEYLALSDIVYTSDNKLVGCNYIRCQYDDSSVDDGEKRGVVQFYMWNRLDTLPVKWISSNHSSNSLRSEQGYTLGISGPTHDCYVFYTGAHNKHLGLRFTELAVVDNQIVGSNYHGYNFLDEEEGSLTKSKIGDKYLLTLSPRDTKASWILDANAIPASERQLVGTNADLKVMGIFPEDAYGKVFTETNFIKYGGKIISVAPYEIDGKLAGVRLYDVTDGLDNPVLIKTNLDLAEPIKVDFAAATLKATTETLTVYLVADHKVITFTTAGVEQPVAKGIYAYGLQVEQSGEEYTFSFTTNDVPSAANLVFFNDADEEVGRIAVRATAGLNKVHVGNGNLPGEVGDVLTWGVEIQGETVLTWAKVHAGDKTFGRGFPAVDNNPESDFFGQIYVADRAGSSVATNGLYIYNPDYTLQNEAPYTGGQTFGSPGRGAVGPNGLFYFADWGDPHSGIWIFDPANPTADAKSFFEGSQTAKGVWSNNGVNIASSTSGIAFYGEGANLRLFAANEDAASPLVSNSINIYNVGKEDGTMVDSWGEAPSEIHAISSMLNGELAIQVTSHGYFVAQTRYDGNNTADVPSLVYHTFDGKRHYNSGSEHKDILNGSRGSGFVVSADESKLAIHNDNQEFVVFDITWEGDTPTLTFDTKFKHGLSDIRQMSLDYAGNVICSGADIPLTVFAMPHRNNIVLTPAKKVLTVVKGSHLITGVENTQKMNVYYNDGTIYNPNGLSLQVFNLTGQLVATGNTNINMTNATKGVYIVRSEAGVLKFIK